MRPDLLGYPQSAKPREPVIRCQKMASRERAFLSGLGKSSEKKIFFEQVAALLYLSIRAKKISLFV